MQCRKSCQPAQTCALYEGLESHNCAGQHVIADWGTKISATGPASWSSGKAFVSGAGGLRFKSRVGQIGHSVANGSPPLRHFFEGSCVARAQ